jgi:hypothetical protein
MHIIRGIIALVLNVILTLIFAAFGLVMGILMFGVIIMVSLVEVLGDMSENITDKFKR